MLQLADFVILCDIYPAREKPIPNITSKIIYDELYKSMKDKCILLSNLDEMDKVIFDILKPGDMVLTMGAGSIWRYSDSFYQNLIKFYN